MASSEASIPMTRTFLYSYCKRFDFDDDDDDDDYDDPCPWERTTMMMTSLNLIY